MNGYEQVFGAVLTDLLALLLVVAVLGLIWLSARRAMLALTRMKALEHELAVYAEASTRVAETVEDMLLSRVKPGETVHSSRRYLLLQARDRLARGEPLRATARSLGLSFDELRLLERGLRRTAGYRQTDETFTDAAAPAP